MKHLSRLFIGALFVLGLTPLGVLAAGPPAHIVATYQTSPFMTEYSSVTLQVFVTDSSGVPVQSPNVRWEGPSSGPRAVFATVTQDPDAEPPPPGYSEVTILPTGGYGAYVITASIENGASVPFQLANSPADVASLVVVSGGGGSTPVNTAFPEPLVVRATSLGGQPVEGAQVMLVPATRGASATVTGVNTRATNADGLATFQLAANSIAGSHRVRLKVPSFGSEVETSATFFNLSSVPTSFQYVSGSAQSVTINGNPVDLQARVLGPTGLPISNVAVDFLVPSSGPGVAAAFDQHGSTLVIPNGYRTQTDSTGIAILSIYANEAPGAYTVSARTSGLEPLSFSLTNVAPTIAAILPNGAPQEEYAGSEARLGGTFEFFFMVTDSQGIPVRNVPLSLTSVPPDTGATGATLQLETTVIVTDDEGIARGSGLANQIAGFHFLRAEAPSGERAFLYLLNRPDGFREGEQLADTPAVDHQGVARTLRSLLTPGRFLILDVCAGWCRPCKDAQAQAQMAKSRLAALGVPVAFVPLLADGPEPLTPSNRTDALAWFSTFHITDQVLHASGDALSPASLAAAYILGADHPGYPTYVLVAPDGRILKNHTSALDADGLVSLVLDQVPSATLSVSSVSVPEGSGSAKIVVSRSAATGTAQVTFTTAPGSATASDFASLSAVLTFGAGQTSTTISIPIVNDSIDEPNETFTVTLSDPSGATLANSQGTVTIADDDAPSAISIDDARFVEGTSNAATNGKVTVHLDRASAFTVSVSYSMVAGSAKSSDVVLTSGTIRFDPGMMVQQIPVSIVADKLVESKETFIITLKAADKATIAAGISEVTIVDDDSDTTPPVIEAVKDVLVEVKMASAGAVIVNYTEPAARDNRDGTVDVTCVAPTGSKHGYGKETVTCAAEDRAGNLATRTFALIVRSPTVAGAIFDPHDRSEPLTETEVGDRVLVQVNANAFDARARVRFALIDARGRRYDLGNGRAERDGSLSEAVELPRGAALGVSQVLAESEGSSGDYDRAWFINLTRDDRCRHNHRHH